jgi:hypothetical protein
MPIRRTGTCGKEFGNANPDVLGRNPGTMREVIGRRRLRGVRVLVESADRATARVIRGLRGRGKLRSGL